MGRISEWMGCVYMDVIPDHYARLIMYSRIDDRALMEARKNFRPRKKNTPEYRVFVDENNVLQQVTMEEQVVEWRKRKESNKQEKPWRD